MSNIFDALKRRERRREAAPAEGAVPIDPVDRAEVEPAAPLNFRISRELQRLRDRVDVELPRTRRRVLAVAAAVAGEGASTVCLQLARSMSTEGQGKVLLIDADLDRAALTLTGAIHAAEGRPGLLDVLAGTVELSKAVLSTDEPDLHFLPSGGDSLSTAGQGRERATIPIEAMNDFLDDMSRVYRVVLVDCPSILEHPDSPALAGLTDGVLLVVRANRTRREIVQRALLLMRGARCPVLGIVLNQRRYPIPEFIYRRL